MSKIRIGIECENLEDPKSRWGVGQVTLNLIREYAKNPEWQKEFELYLYFKKRIPEDDVFQNHYSKFKIRILGVPSFNIFYHIIMPIRAMLDRLDWMFFPAYMLPPLYLGRSIVLLTNDVYYEYKHGSLPFKYKLAYRLFTNWAAIKAKKILAISEASKKEVAKLYKINPERIFVSHLGVDSINQKSKIKNQNYNSKFKNEDYILYIGQAFPRRHLKEVILAFKKISLDFPNLKLVAVGKDKYSPPIIKNLVRDINQQLGSEKVIYHEYLDDKEDMEGLYSGARTLVYVSDHEAFGLPPVEALSYGVPPVVMENELGHEIFSNYAVYSKSGSVDDIANAMQEVLKSDVSRFKTEGPEFVKKYNWTNFADKFFNAIK